MKVDSCSAAVDGEMKCNGRNEIKTILSSSCHYTSPGTIVSTESLLNGKFSFYLPWGEFFQQSAGEELFRNTKLIPSAWSSQVFLFEVWVKLYLKSMELEK